MASISSTIPAKECGVCHQEFDGESRCPRILECFHTLCTKCLDRLIRSSSKSCPFCYQGFKWQCVKDVRINESVLELTKYIAFLRSSVSSALKDEDVTDSSGTSNSLSMNREATIQNLANCQEAQDKLEIAIQRHLDLKNNIQKKHEEFKKTVTDIVDEITVQSQGKVKELGNAISEMERRLCGVLGKQEKLEEGKGRLETLYGTSEDAAPVVYGAQKTNVDVQEFLKNFKIFFSNKEILRDKNTNVMQRTEAKMNIVVELLKSCREVEKEIVAMPALTLQKASPLKMTPEKLHEMSDPIKCLVERGKVFVVHHNDANRRISSKIYFTNDNKLCFSCLTEELVPYNVHLLEYNDLMRLSGPSSRLVFLELGADGSSLGRIYIRFDTDSALTEQFTFLCTGVTGPSYLKTQLLEVFRKKKLWEWIRFGDYENNDGSGGKQLVSGQGVEGEAKRPCLAGTLEGWYGCGFHVASQFLIHIKDSPKAVSCDCSAFVEEGLSILGEAVCRYPDICDVCIIDCGIALPFSLPQ